MLINIGAGEWDGVDSDKGWRYGDEVVQRQY